ncbi:MAG: bifunctional DNA-formamidopyrimidine glycosylase/DNA-(apurinic or apyrimidinic site) lyase [bacterium]|nr:bifunctional DNA-formamidopyrimidine glycosylase/DNA-(apurinic or apyrimidinic site) lyase [bacterium]
MPELPEVQTIVNDLNKKVVGRRIVGVWFDWPKMLKDPLDQQKNKIAHKHVAIFEKVIKGKKILKVVRRAKNILIYLSGDFLLLIHLKMTGHLLIGKWKVVGKKTIPLEPKEVVEDPYNQYIHLIFYLDPVRSRSPQGGRSHSLKARAASNGVDDGAMLALSDLRKFAKALLGTKEQIENLPEIKNLGPEPLDPSFKFAEFVKLIKSERRKIKQVLMDPEVIAGIGNIYSDDILWAAKIHPFKPANKLGNQELGSLYKAIRKVLEKALKLRGTSYSDYRDTSGKEGGYADYRLVYQREDEPCRRCKTAIVRVKLGGRSAHFCPKCQKL